MASHLKRMQLQQQQREQNQQGNYDENEGGFYAASDMNLGPPVPTYGPGYGFRTSQSNLAPSQLAPSDMGARHQPNPYSASAYKGSMISFQHSNLTGKPKSMRSNYSAELKLSRSLGASKASLATVKSARSTIQAEFHDLKVHEKLNAVSFGKARIPYIWSLVFFFLFLLTLFLGLLIFCLRHVYLNILLSLDIGEMTGPMLIAGSFLFLGIAFKFLHDAYVLGAKERTFIRYKPSSHSTVQVANTKGKKAQDEENLISGKTTEDAVTRAPVGGMSVFNAQQYDM